MNKSFLLIAFMLLLITSCHSANQKPTEVLESPRYQIAVCDWMILKRQKLGAFGRAVEIGCDGLELDLGGLGNRPTFDNKLLDPIERRVFLEKSQETGIKISSIALSGFYAQNFAKREGIERIMDDAINTIVLMGVNTAFLPLGVEGDLIKFPERRSAMIERLQLLGRKAEAAEVVFGIETSYNAKEEAQFIDEIGSPAIKSYFNFSNAIDAGLEISEEIKILGKDRIAMIHASGKDSVWIENDPHINLPEIKRTLDNIGWSGWLVIERSRDEKQPHNVVGNFGANTAYLKKIFQE